jgi:hypothetical protein
LKGTPQARLPVGLPQRALRRLGYAELRANQAAMRY